ncbi:MAG: signal peptidase II [Pseudomonadales bacterium]|nr:signal peptidase II [Pseudomonadales bacterium]
MNNKYFFFSLIIIDQTSKFFAKFLGFPVALNFGISLNLLSFLPTSMMTLFLVFAIFFIFYFFKKDWVKNLLVASLFFAGAISNIIDRIIFGGVRDWLKMPFFNIHNNLADWFIFIGLGLFLFTLFHEEMDGKIN